MPTESPPRVEDHVALLVQNARTRVAAAVQTGVDLVRRREVEAAAFKLRDGKQLGQLLLREVRPQEASTFAVGPAAAAEAFRLLGKFVPILSEQSNEPLDERVIRWMWAQLQGAQPKTVADYAERLVRVLTDLGVRGVKTRRFLLAKAALRRLSVMIRPNRAYPVTLAQVRDMADKLGRQRDTQAQAYVLLGWLLRSRLSDLRYLVREDVDRLENGGLRVYLKEKQQRKPMPPVYVAPGPWTDVVWDYVRTSRREFLFGGPQEFYHPLLERVRKVAPEEFVMGSMRRGAAHHIEEAEEPELTEMQALLRHQTPRVTRGYMAEVSSATMRNVERLTRSMQ